MPSTVSRAAYGTLYRAAGITIKLSDEFSESTFLKHPLFAMIESSQQVDALHRNWIWVHDWQDSSAENTAGRLVSFIRRLTLDRVPPVATIHCTADTRYKLLVNGSRVTVGPSRSSPERWLYDTIDIAPLLRRGDNTITVIVLRYFYATRAAMPFVRTGYPGLTLIGTIGGIDVRTGLCADWSARVDNGTMFPTELEDDVFLHINERVAGPYIKPAKIKPYTLRLVNGELPPWRLHAREIPLPEQTPVAVDRVQDVVSSIPGSTWAESLRMRKPITLPGNSAHRVDLLADCHSTAFTKWSFRSSSHTTVRLQVTYSEAYELEPRRYPWLRTKDDRLDSTNGRILGPCDEVILRVDGDCTYEPFWFRTFRILRVEMACGPNDVDFVSLEATQTNYPMDVKAKWEDGDEYSGRIMDISIRTMRNCMFDAYSDCPFYEQLSYSGDSRSVSLFHYLLSGDDRLARQTITSFAGSVTPQGLTQSRYPSQVQQVIAGFSLYWILQVHDHLLYFGDISYARSFLPIVDGILEFFDRHIDHLGLVSGLPSEVWQFVDWVTGWHETDEHPDKGVPTAGRESNRHTYFSMLYAWTLQHAARLVRNVGRPQYATEYESRAKSVVAAITKHCFDKRLGLFTDSTSDVPYDTPAPMSQHVQVFAVLCGAADGMDTADLLRRSFGKASTLGKCSYVMMFYAFRAFAKAGIYEEMYHPSWAPWRRMIKQNLSTWEEDDVRQRSDCHAWGSVPVYEYLSEVAGIESLSPGCRTILFSPRVALSGKVDATIALGGDNVARVLWARQGQSTRVTLQLEQAVRVISRDPKGKETDCGVTDLLELVL